MNIYLTPFLLTLCIIFLVYEALGVISLVATLILKSMRVIITQRKINELKRFENDYISRMKSNNLTFENSNEFFDALCKDINKLYNNTRRGM